MVRLIDISMVLENDKVRTQLITDNGNYVYMLDSSLTVNFLVVDHYILRERFNISKDEYLAYQMSLNASIIEVMRVHDIDEVGDLTTSEHYKHYIVHEFKSLLFNAERM